MRKRLVVGNWKMNGGLAANAALLAALARDWKSPPDREIAVCVPYPYLAQAQAALRGTAVGWGAQDVSEHAPGRTPARCPPRCWRSSAAGTC